MKIAVAGATERGTGEETCKKSDSFQPGVSCDLIAPTLSTFTAKDTKLDSVSVIGGGGVKYKFRHPGRLTDTRKSQYFRPICNS